MKIAAYFSPLSRIANATGVGQHVIGMFDGLASDPRVTLSVVSTATEYRSGRSSLSPAAQACRVDFLPPHERLMRVALTATPFLAADRWASGPDWIYCPKEQPVTTRRAKLAVTIHDLLPFEPEIPGLPRQRSQMRMYWATRNIRRIAQRADLILTVSEFTRRRMTELFNVPESRMVVVGNGVSSYYFRERSPDDMEKLDQYNLESGAYFVAVGSLTWRKGGDLLLDVARRLQQSTAMSGLRIVVVGRRHDPDLVCRLDEMRQSCPGLPLSLMGYVPDNDLALLLSHSRGLLFPSRYEGFGIPILEAMAVGTPVVCADSSALPEVAGGLAYQVKSNSADALWDGIQSLLAEDSISRESRVTVGRERGRKCTWHGCSERLVSALIDRI